ncbi:class I SAM-dependent methyltransferase [Ureibacillus sp. FSL W8-0352]|uniref:class I SAM-dependent methyltransferase n=1 Tax=Ureibacillus sp. FSL W8-0352 TaxID=2954596 RepID=UPI0030F517F7
MSTIQKDHWNPVLYDEQHSFVSKFGSSLIDYLAPKKGENILDVGCGSGDLAQKIANTGASVN